MSKKTATGTALHPNSVAAHTVKSVCSGLPETPSSGCSMGCTVKMEIAAGRVESVVGAGSAAGDDAGDTWAAGDTSSGETGPEEQYTVFQPSSVAQPVVYLPASGYSADTDRP